jgi:hypothetical protein
MDRIGHTQGNLTLTSYVTSPFLFVSVQADMSHLYNDHVRLWFLHYLSSLPQ